MFDRVKLRRDLTDCGGRVLARAGTVISVESIAEAAASTRPGCVNPLSDTFLADDLAEILREPVLRFLLRTAEIEQAVRRVVEAATLPQPLVEEMAAAKLLDPVRYRHALSTALVTARLILAAAGTARASPQIAAAALLHDIGMRHVPPRVMATPDSTGRMRSTSRRTRCSAPSTWPARSAATPRSRRRWPITGETGRATPTWPSAPRRPPRWWPCRAPTRR
jgi:hypothetical protein